jgi:trehalose 6-phosphate phosphatase
MDATRLTPPAPQKDWVYFLDFDGTLVDIAEDPEGIRVERELVRLLAEVSRITDGGVILVSGRAIADLDLHLHPLKLPSAGLHGLEYRMIADGPVMRNTAGNGQLDPARRELAAFAAAWDGVLLEDKGASLALHYRRAPEAAAAAKDAAENACRKLGGTFICLAGKMVYEVKPRDAHKGQAIARFLGRNALARRRPVFLGDDVTDEDGFRACNDEQGISIRVGDPRTETLARYRLENVGQVEAWLGQMINNKTRPAS